MKKILLFFAILLVTINVGAQIVIFGNVPHKAIDRGIFDNGKFLWSLDAVIGGPEFTLDNKVSLISGAGFAIGYQHYKPDLSSDWGINLGVMTKVQIGEEQEPILKLALLPSFHRGMAGPTYLFDNSKKFYERLGLMVGASIYFR